MNNLNFDVNAMTHPKDVSDIIAVLREAIHELEYINRYFDVMLYDANNEIN